VTKSDKSTLSIVLPCLNEAETIEICLQKAFSSLKNLNVNGEVIVADNGSSDGSQHLARINGARVIDVPTKGYGAALLGGIRAAKTEYVVMGDADDSYALDNLDLFLDRLISGDDLVMGNRFQGGIEKGAMPWLHKYLGNPVLSWLGRLLFKVPIRDFHCGLRAFRRESILALNLQSTGMEFASEMVVKAQIQGLKISEVPTRLRPDGRSRAPHLRTWRDGYRHLVFLLAASPRWLFLYPGIFLTLLGIIGTISLTSGPKTIGALEFNLNSYFFFIGFVITGVQIILFGILARIFSSNFGFLPKTSALRVFVDRFTLERGIVLGVVLIFFSLLLAFLLLGRWSGSSLVGLSGDSSLRISGVVLLFSCVGSQVLFASFFAAILQTKKI
jgi:glycosyltransferase involved in cell wall biosynthesis